MGRRTREWNTDDITLQHLYGLSLFKPEEAQPRFGSGVKLPLVIGTWGGKHERDTSKGKLVVSREGKAEHLPPTLLNLSWHFGYMQWALDNVATIVRLSKGRVQAGTLDERFFLAAQDYAKHEFEIKRLNPLRKALLEQEHPLYLYCVPSVIVETDLVSGEQLTAEGDRVLCVLPVNTPCAEHHRLQEAKISLIAPQVVWLVKLLCSYHVIRTPLQLTEAMNGWLNYLSPGVIEQVQESIRQISPQLLPAQLQ
jgi:hypothetical protein